MNSALQESCFEGGKTKEGVQNDRNLAEAPATSEWWWCLAQISMPSLGCLTLIKSCRGVQRAEQELRNLSRQATQSIVAAPLMLPEGGEKLGWNRLLFWGR